MTASTDMLFTDILSIVEINKKNKEISKNTRYVNNFINTCYWPFPNNFRYDILLPQKQILKVENVSELNQTWKQN